ncbi:MAG: PaaI family thioesterase [Myxococcota bacterium]|nr:PaaI family thioesterase [Myxococcota bacterium]
MSLGDADDDALRVPDVVRRAFRDRPPGRVIAPGHPIGDFLGAPDWELLAEDEGFLHVRATLPERVRNPRGHLFGGFTPTYVDLVALCTFRAGRALPEAERWGWLATLNMRVDYFEPIVGTFEIVSRVLRRGGATAFVETRFQAPEDERPLAFALTTLRETSR